MNHPPEAEMRMWIHRNDLSASGNVRQLSLSCHESGQERAVYTRRNGYNRRGQLISSHLTDEGGNLHALLISADYHANGACQQEMLGNGVTRYYAQEHFTKRLLRISTWRPGGNKNVTRFRIFRISMILREMLLSVMIWAGRISILIICGSRHIISITTIPATAYAALKAVKR